MRFTDEQTRKMCAQTEKTEVETLAIRMAPGRILAERRWATQPGQQDF